MFSLLLVSFSDKRAQHAAAATHAQFPRSFIGFICGSGVSPVTRIQEPTCDMGADETPLAESVYPFSHPSEEMQQQ